MTVTLDEEEEVGDLFNTREIREPQQPHDADEAEKTLSTSEHIKKHQQRPTGKKSNCCSDCGQNMDTMQLGSRRRSSHKLIKSMERI
ncbi:putative zinc finger protein 137 isoform X2 [Salvelinus fontinalis]|uniref:putative zinc finger protein 137 isoform X2 n=1 Tax=Salvelinus fontinalis TaxID=8038 RepID=UPI0024862391|nr:putative zinc finger protein 137 isoform X2 [Salvelinus fontinalis]